MIKTPLGLFPSKSDAIRVLGLGDFTALNSWLNGKVVTRHQVHAQKNNHIFKLEDVGKLTTSIGWGYVPIEFPSK